ncbi:MAG: RNA methyltransferase [Dehalococcoidales bacterium]|jgi:TrmH family RNA methyltransferase
MATPLKSLKWYRGLADRKGRLEAGAFPVEGDKAIRQVMAAQPDAILEIVSVDEAPPHFRPYPQGRVSAAQFRYISSAQTPQGIMAIVRQPADVYTDALPQNPGRRILLLEDIQDPGNAGTLIRTAAALDYDGVILTESSADPLSPKCVQASAGTVLSVWLRRTAQYREMAQTLKKQGYSLAAADLKGDTAPDVLPGREKLVLALGNEAAGLSPELLAAADCRVRIPVAPEKAESLNVAACGAILMYLSAGK